MRRTIAALAVVCAVFEASPVASAEDPPAPPPTKSRLFARDRWKVGETTTEARSRRQTVFANVALGSPSPQPRVTLIGCTIVRRCHEVDAAGHWLRGEAYLKRWVRSQDKEQDRSLEGAFIDIASDGTWKIADTKTAPSADASKWVESMSGSSESIGGDGDGVAGKDVPGDELSIGTPVPVRATRVEAEAAEIGAPVPAKGFATRFELSSIETTAAGPKIAYTERLDASLVGSGRIGGESAKYVSGSAIHVHADVKKVLGACHAYLSLHRDHDVVIVVDRGQGPVRAESIYSETVERTPGGDVPPRPPARGK